MQEDKNHGSSTQALVGVFPSWSISLGILHAYLETLVVPIPLWKSLSHFPGGRFL